MKNEKHTSGAKAPDYFAALTAVRVKTLTYQSCPDMSQIRFEVSHPSRKNKYAARMGHPEPGVTSLRF